MNNLWAFLCGALATMLLVSVKINIDIVNENETLKVALAGLATERVMAAMHDVPDEEL